MANSVDPDEMAHYEPSHLDLQCLQWYMFCSAGLKELIFYHFIGHIQQNDKLTFFFPLLIFP